MDVYFADDSHFTLSAGPTAIQEIRKEGYRGPIVSVTGNVLRCDKDTMMSAGASIVMEKPFDVDLFWKWFSSYAIDKP